MGRNAAKDRYIFKGRFLRLQPFDAVFQTPITNKILACHFGLSVHHIPTKRNDEKRRKGNQQALRQAVSIGSPRIGLHPFGPGLRSGFGWY